MRNTIPDTVLEQVSVVMSFDEDAGLTEDFLIPIPSLDNEAAGVVYVSYTRSTPSAYTSASFQNTLKFTSKEVDPVTGEPEEEGYADEYQLEEVDIGAGDYIVPSYANFATEWDRLRAGSTATETFALTALESLKGALACHLGSVYSF